MSSIIGPSKDRIPINMALYKHSMKRNLNKIYILIITLENENADKLLLK